MVFLLWSFVYFYTHDHFIIIAIDCYINDLLINTRLNMCITCKCYYTEDIHLLLENPTEMKR